MSTLGKQALKSCFRLSAIGCHVMGATQCCQPDLNETSVVVDADHVIPSYRHGGEPILALGASLSFHSK